MDYNNLNEQNTQPTEKSVQEQIKKQKRSGAIAKKLDKLEKEVISLYSKIQKKEKEIARLRQEFKELF